MSMGMGTGWGPIFIQYDGTVGACVATLLCHVDETHETDDWY